jgi:hypothetical protein
MPCDSITTQTIKLAKAMPEIIEAALKDLDYTVTSNIKTRIIAKQYNSEVVWEAGKGISITGRNNEQHLNEITQTYSKQAVTWAAKRAGWSVTNINNNTLTVRR